MMSLGHGRALHDTLHFHSSATVALPEGFGVLSFLLAFGGGVFVVFFAMEMSSENLFEKPKSDLREGNLVGISEV